MKKKFIYLAAMLLALAACDNKGKEPEPPPEPEPPKNMTLYDKPLDVVKGVVEGRWEVYCTHTGSIIGDIVDYPTNSHITFNNGILTMEGESDDKYHQTNYTWVKKGDPVLPSTISEAYSIRIESGNELVRHYFPIHILNDTLHLRGEFIAIDYGFDLELINKETVNQKSN